MNTPKILSLFSGCGGLDLGFCMEGYETVWANDFDETAVETFRANLGDGICYGDITKIDPYDPSIPDCDLILGGFPCQDFSIAGQRQGLNGTRGYLFQSFAAFVEAKKPKAFVAENVKGILSANKGKAMATILETFEAIAPGYDVQPRLYNFAEYGVPQARERVLFVGIRQDTGFAFTHPQPSHGPRAGRPFVTAGEALAGVESVPANNAAIHTQEKTGRMLDLIPEGGNYADVPKDSPLRVKAGRSNIYRRIARDEPAKTLIAAGGGGTWGYHYSQPRALTNRERARLQSFPDDFVFIGNITQVRRQIGNAVPPEGVRAVARSLKPLFEGGEITPENREQYF